MNHFFNFIFKFFFIFSSLSYADFKPTKIFFHGCDQTSEDFKKGLGIDGIYPQAKHHPKGCWSFSNPVVAIAQAKDLIEELEKEEKLNPPVIVAGLSSGAVMAQIFSLLTEVELLFMHSGLSFGSNLFLPFFPNDLSALFVMKNPKFVLNSMVKTYLSGFRHRPKNIVLIHGKSDHVVHPDHLELLNSIYPNAESNLVSGSHAWFTQNDSNQKYFENNSFDSTALLLEKIEEIEAN